MTMPATCTTGPDRRRRARLSRRRAGLSATLAGLAALCLLVSACGGSNSPSSTTPAESAQLDAALSFSRCMRSHGVPNFPDPDAQGNFPPFGLAHGESKPTALSAQTTCEHLMRAGSGAGTAAQHAQKQQQGLKLAECIRSHGFPNYPDPTLSAGGLHENIAGTGIDENSPQFQAAQNTCQAKAYSAGGGR